MEESVKDRIIKVIQALGISTNRFEKEAGLSTGYLRQLRRDPTTDKFKSIILAFPEINAHWLLTGEGDMIGKPQSLEKPQTPEISYTEGVPYYDEDFLLGFSEMIPTGHEHPEYLIKMPGYEKATLWCNASGHSMEPEINNGDIIALKRIDDFSFLPYGDIYGIITTNGLRTIKRLGRSSHEGCYKLIPTNTQYDEQDIPISKIAIVYRVMGAMKAF